MVPRLAPKTAEAEGLCHPGQEDLPMVLRGLGHEAKNKTIRKRQSYQKWLELSQWLDCKPSKQEILKRMHSLLDGHCAFGSYTAAKHSRESLELVLQETVVPQLCPDCGKAELETPQEREEAICRKCRERLIWAERNCGDHA